MKRKYLQINYLSRIRRFQAVKANNQYLFRQCLNLDPTDIKILNNILYLVNVFQVEEKKLRKVKSRDGI